MVSRKIRATLVAAFLLLGTTHADARTESTLDANALSMNVVGGYFIVVKASIGDRHDLNFLLDTGATTSAIDSTLAERLNLSTHSSQMVNFDKTLQIQWCVLP
jgi:predicted aspartyl protease